MGMGSDGKVVIDTEVDSKGLSTGLSKLGGVAGTALKGTMVAIGAGAAAAGTAIAAVGTQAIKAYANYEQLVGGVETLFGTQGQSMSEYACSVGKSVLEINKEYNRLNAAQELVMRNASNAYKTAGLSANEYMETVTSFSASLIASLEGDTLKAANVSNRIITDMSDNANKMGTDMSLIQNAYNGFAKQNYTMLDNLKLGYGGTKEEMKRLIEDASKMTDVQEKLGIKVDEGSMSFANIANAISVVQTKMGITGTTAKEAGSTIQGSISMMKGAWENFVTGMADPDQNFDVLLGNLVDSIVTVAENLVPRIAMMLPRLIEGISSLIQSIVAKMPEMMEPLSSQLPTIVSGVLPSIITGLQYIIDGLIQALPAAIQMVVDILPQLFEAFFSIMSNLGISLINAFCIGLSGIGEMLPDLIATVGQGIEDFTQSIYDLTPDLVDAGIDLLKGLVSGFKDPEGLKNLVSNVYSVMDMLMWAIIDSLPELMLLAGEALSQLAEQIILAVPVFVNFLMQLVQSLLDTLPDIINVLVAVLPMIVESIVNALIVCVPQLVQAGVQLLTALVEDLPKIIDTIVNNLPGLIESIVTALLSMLPMLVDCGLQLFVALIQNMPQIITTLVEALPRIIKAIIDGLIACVPQIVLAGVQLLTSLVVGLPTIIAGILAAVPKIINSLKKSFLSYVSSFKDIGVNLIKGIGEGIVSAKDWLVDKIKDLCDNALDTIKKFFGIHSPSRVMRDEVGQWLAKGIGVGFDEYYPTKQLKSTMQNGMKALQDSVNMQLSANVGDIKQAGGTTQIINVNKEVSTPDDIARALRIESRYPILGGIG